VHRRQLLATAATLPLVGCATFDGGNDGSSELDLTVQNDRSGPVDVDVTVTDEDGTTYESTSDRVDAGVARAFQVTVGASGRHEAVVEGEDWEGRVAWQADKCSLFDGRVRVGPGTVDVATECVQQR